MNTSDKQLSKPNLFILGAPKCGTTALSWYLDQHPDIFISKPKEIHFFSDDLNYPVNRQKSLNEYLEIFIPGRDYKIRGEASVFYLFSKTAIGNIMQFNPNAKFIAMIRNPFEMAPSRHKQYVYNGSETEFDFNKAWALQADRRDGYSLPKSKRKVDPKQLQYADVCSLGTQLERAKQIIPPENLKVILFDDFKDNTLKIYKETLAFLQVEYDGTTQFPKINEATSVKSKMVHLAINNIPDSLLALANFFKKKLGINRIGLTTLIRDINTRPQKENDINEETYKQMSNAFMPEINKLERLLSRDLSHWHPKI